MKSPIVSIIVPTFKRTEYLKLTLESILNQSFQNFEIIVVDDGTPNDDNFLLCDTIDKVNYIKIKNTGGPAKPRNVGIENAKGKYIAFVDDDDLWNSEKLKKQVEVLENYSDFGLVHNFCQVINEQGFILDEVIGKPRTADVKHGDVSLKMIGNWTIMMPTPLVRKSVIDKVGGFNEIIPGTFADVEYWVRTSFYTKFYYIDEPLVQYRLHNQNMSSQTSIYIQLPLYLKNVLQEQLNKNLINKKEYNLLLNSLCKMQISNLHINFFKTLILCFHLDYFWIFKHNNLKMLIYLALYKKIKK
jgi:glycosyltransferase involved in cell wall biosynthesis